MSVLHFLFSSVFFYIKSLAEKPQSELEAKTENMTELWFICQVGYC